MKSKVIFFGIAIGLICSAALVRAEPIVLRINADKVAAKVSPTLYGLMTEEINFSYDGGLYAELIRNRTFQDKTDDAQHWSVVKYNGGDGEISLDKAQPLNDALPISLKLDASKLGANQRVGVANDGYWGIPARPNTTYRASFFARGSENITEPLTVSIESADGATVLASVQTPPISAGWKQYQVELKTGDITPSKANRFVITTGAANTVWLNLVSLFPPTFKDRPNGNRIDIMQKLVDMKPQFLRFPGGNYVEGQNLANRFDFKKTIGPVSQRPGHMSPWRYRSSDGMGLLEFMDWVEDMHAQPVLAVFAGYTLDRKSVAEADLAPFVQDALDEIEYVTGDASTKWGAQRSADGHPEPFKLTYVEIGNEDNLDRSGSYSYRFPPFFDAIKTKYPQLQIIATAPVRSRKPDVIDEHAYWRAASQPERDAHRFDKRDRQGPKVFMGEWATRIGAPTTNFAAALGDAAFMTGLERNSDLVVMSCYAPIFVNVNPGGMQWSSDMIGYDAMDSYGSPSYYAQKLFSNYLGDVVCESTIDGVPLVMPPPPPAPASNSGGGPTSRPVTAARPAPPRGPVEELYYSVTRDTKTGKIYLKVVNISPDPLSVQINISGSTIANEADCLLMTTDDPKNTNSITDPTKIVPVPSKVNDAGTSFTHAFPASSITVLTLSGG